MAFNQQLSVLGQVAPANTGTAGQVLVSAGSSASSYWASAIPVSAYSAQFNGSTQYLTIPSSASVTSNFTFGSSDFTIESWIYPTTGYSGGDIFGKRANGSVYSAINLGIASSSGLKATIIGSTTGSSWDVTYTVGSINIPFNAWTHIALARNGSNFRVFVNGVLDFTVTNSGALYTESSNAVAIGSSTADGSAKFQGYLSNYRIVKGVAVYTGAFTVPTSPLGTSQAAGTNIAAVTPSQVSLLTCNGPGLIDSSPNAYTLTNNGNAVTSQYAPFSSFSAISRSATQTQTILTSGSGTYYTPSGVAWLRIRMVGGGGGGGGGGGASTGGSGTAGTSTTFGTSFLTAGGGMGGTQAIVSGGSASIGSGATGIALTGGAGTSGSIAHYYATGAIGGTSPFGGAGGGGRAVEAGTAATTNSGSGGGGGACYTNAVGNNTGGTGGGSGGYVEAYISTPAASYAYAVGAGGGGGAAGTSGYAGGGGGSGVIIVEENYAVNASGGATYPAGYLIVAGGGAGGGYLDAGGGGAGGLISGSTFLTGGTVYTITVGAGGATSSTSTYLGASGTNSSISGMIPGLATTSIGGGGGASYQASGAVAGANGGSGGGWRWGRGGGRR